MLARTRNTVATRRRLDNIRTIIAALGGTEMDIDALCDLLHFSPSGARKYIRELRAVGVMEIGRYADGTVTYLGRAMFRLADPSRVDDFLSMLNADVTPPQRKPSVKRQPPDLAGRNIHIMADDSRYPLRVSRVVVARNPLVAALFGPAATEKEFLF